MNEMDTQPISPRPGRWRGRFKRLGGAIRRAAPFAAGIAAAFAGLLLYNAFFPGPRPLTTQDVNNTVAQVMASATPPPAFSEQVYQVIQPSLVLVETQGKDASGKTDHALGSGFIINDAGEIMTSLHVVADATKIQVTFADGSQSEGQISAQSPKTDTALLKAAKLPAKFVPAVLGNPGAMRVGDEAYAVGNPFGLYSSMSAGVISGFNRTFQPPGTNQELQGLIQFDAAVNPGNSGGPLLNRDGQVIGIVTGIVNPSGQDVFIGIGFAVPINASGGGLGSPVD
jgi:S1-C subfamily serine protease